MYCVAEQGGSASNWFRGVAQTETPGITVGNWRTNQWPGKPVRDSKSLSAKPIADEAYVIPAGYTELAYPAIQRGRYCPCPLVRPSDY